MDIQSHTSPSIRSQTTASVANNHNLAPMPILGRASHTSNLQRFEQKYEQLKAYPREKTDSSLNVEFWQKVRGILASCQDPVGYEESPNSTDAVAKGPEDIQKFAGRVGALSLINPIYPAALAKSVEIEIEDVLTELLYACKVGMLQIRWAPECIRCGSAVVLSNFLGDLPSHAHCGGCQQENTISHLDRIMVTFTFSPEILYILANNYPCTPSPTSMEANLCFVPMPATNNGSGFRYSFGCGESPMGDAFPKGKYRVHCPVSMTDHYLVVERDSTESDDPHVLDYYISEMVVTDPYADRKVVSIPHGKVHFNLFPDTRSFFVLWVQENLDEETLMCLPDQSRMGYTSAQELINHPSFYLFEDQIVPQGTHSLEMSEVVLVFTDIVGSTDLYAQLGDGEALLQVRRYFEVLFHSMAKRGRIVKTIGDAVMASFASSEQALEAVAEALQELKTKTYNPTTQSSIEMRVGIHKGSTLVIPVNGINDYFGQTVNIAARVQSKANASQCLVSQAVLDHEEARLAYEKVLNQSSFQKLDDQDLQLKGVKQSVSVCGFTLNS